MENRKPTRIMVNIRIDSSIMAIANGNEYTKVIMRKPTQNPVFLSNSFPIKRISRTDSYILRVG